MYFAWLGVAGRRCPTSIFRGVLPQTFLQEEHERARRGRGAGIIPDGMLSRVSFETTRRRILNFLLDFKFIHGSESWYTPGRLGQRARVVNDRAAAVDKDYETAARKLDSRHHGLPDHTEQRARCRARQRRSYLPCAPHRGCLKCGTSRPRAPSTWRCAVLSHAHRKRARGDKVV